MFGFFSWVRNQTRQAVLQGLADATDELENVEAPAFDADAWRKKFAAQEARQLPPAARGRDSNDDEGKGKKGRER